MSTIQHTIQHTIQRAYKTELDLNNEQITACKRHAGAARWAYNWGLARKQESYHATGTSPSAMDLHRELNALKQTEVPWMYEVSKCAPQEALRNLDSAFSHFFRRCQLKQQGKWRWLEFVLIGLAYPVLVHTALFCLIAMKRQGERASHPPLESWGLSGPISISQMLPSGPVAIPPISTFVANVKS